MMTKQQKRKVSGKAGHEQKPSSMLTTTLTEHEIATLKNVLYGYLGFLRKITSLQPEKRETLTRLQPVYDRLPDHLTSDDVIYFSYEERIAILEAVIGFQFLLVISFPQTAHRDAALAEVEHLYQCLTLTRPLSLN